MRLYNITQESTEIHAERRTGQTERKLSPKGLASLINETLQIYLQTFSPFIQIGTIPTLPLIISVFLPTWIGLILTIFSILITMLAIPAATSGTAHYYLKTKVSAVTCYSHAWNRVVSIGVASLLYLVAIIFCVGIIVLASVGEEPSLWQLPLLFLGLFLLCLILINFFFIEQAIIIERLGALQSLKRSVRLVSGNRLRVFILGITYILLTFGLLTIAVGITNELLSFNKILAAVIINIFQILLFPIVPIGTTLIYLDLRVRTEGYNLDTLKSEVGFSEPIE